MKQSDFKSEEQLRSMKVADIKKHVRAFNDHYKISGYSKLKKDQLISQVLTAQMRVRNSGKAAPKPPAPKPATPAKKSETPSFVKDGPKKTYSQALRLKNKFEDKVIEVPYEIFKKAYQLSSGHKDPEKRYGDAAADRFEKSLNRALKSSFKKLFGTKEFTPPQWEGKWRKFIEEEEENLDKQLKKRVKSLALDTFIP